MSAPAIRSEALTRDFGRLRALDGLTIDVPPGRVVALLGPNGAGKTTFLRLLTGLLEPTAGRAAVLGCPLGRITPEVRQRLAVVGQDQDPPRWATLRRLLRLQAGASPRFDRALAERLCRRRALALSRPFGALSKGQKRWVLAALALAAGADLLLLDEPAEGLDPSARRDLYDALRDHVNACDATAVVATHVISDIERVADDVAILHRGRLALHGDLEELREEVREVELPDGRSLEDLRKGPAPRAGLIATRRVNGAVLAWVRCPGAGAGGLQEALGPQAVVRTVDLETLYLAVTEQPPDTREEKP